MNVLALRCAELPAVACTRCATMLRIKLPECRLPIRARESSEYTMVQGIECVVIACVVNRPVDPVRIVSHMQRELWQKGLQKMRTKLIGFPELQCASRTTN